jgi:tetratricopeptide (TPR) repeat protein
MNNECQNCDSKICTENGCIEERSPREFTDPYVVAISAQCRAQAAEQMAEIRRIYYNMKRVMPLLEKIVEVDPTKNEYLFYKSLSNEKQKRFETYDIDGCLERIQDSIKDYKSADKRQDELNCIRLALMGDVDFRSGPYWESLISISEKESATAKRR